MIKNYKKENNYYEKYNCFGNSIFVIPIDNKKNDKIKNNFSCGTKEKNEIISNDCTFSTNDESNDNLDIFVYFTRILKDNWKYKIYQLKINYINSIKNVLN